MLIDTHCHLNFKAFQKDYREITDLLLKEKMKVIVVGTQLNTSERAVEIAAEFPDGVYAAVGLHPIHLMDNLVTEEEDTFHAKNENFDKNNYRRLILNSKKVVGIGEIGLDNYWLKNLTPSEQLEQKEKQKKVFMEQLDLAEELNLPVIIHCRDAHAEMLEILEDKFTARKDKLNGVIHCFSGNLKQSEKYIGLGFMLGFNGVVTYSPSYDKVISNAPRKKILLETDAPYLTPLPLPKSERNIPQNVKYVAEKIAKVLGVSTEDVGEFTASNAMRLFKV